MRNPTCFYIYVLPDPLGEKKHTFSKVWTTWRKLTKTGRFCAILYHVPASWSWSHREECCQTHWLLLLWLQRSLSPVDWWIYWGHHLVTEHIEYIRSRENIHVDTDVALDAVWPLYQFLREVITKKRIAWFDPCLRTVAVRPWYVPLIPNKRNRDILGIMSDAVPHFTSRCQACTETGHYLVPLWFLWLHGRSPCIWG